MALKDLSITFTTEDIDTPRAFYEKHFDAKAIFDCGWYLVLRLKAEKDVDICFMNPQEGAPAYQGGTTLNLKYDNVDPVHKAIAPAGLTEVMPLEDHPWGDRGFAVLDPLGTAVYCYHDTEADEEYKKFLIK